MKLPKEILDMHDKMHHEFVMNYELQDNEYYMITTFKGIRFCNDINKIQKLKEYVSIDIYRGNLNKTHIFL